MNCKDESDEDTCNLIVFKNNYNKKVPPFTVMADFSVLPAKILVSTKLENVLAISEFSHTIDLKIQIKLRWYENRVLYHNLKYQEALNVLTDLEVRGPHHKVRSTTKWSQRAETSQVEHNFHPPPTPTNDPIKLKLHRSSC